MRLLPSILALLLLAPFRVEAQSSERRLYFVPGAHYATVERGTFSVAAFLDGRRGMVGKGNIAILEGGRDAVKAQIGIADVRSPVIGYAAQLSAMRTLRAPLDAVPNSSYAGTEFHLFVTVVNFGVGYYSPVGAIKGRRGLVSFSAGLGF